MEEISAGKQMLEDMKVFSLAMRKLLSAYSADTGAQLSHLEVKAFLRCSATTQGVTVEEIIEAQKEHDKQGAANNV